MSESNHANEAWQVEVNGQVYEASFVELTEWIADGGLQPQDMVRRGNLRWIEARKVPKLIPFFNAKSNGFPPPEVVITTTDAALDHAGNGWGSAVISTENAVVQSDAVRILPDPPIQATVEQSDVVVDSDRCANHQDRTAAYVCLSCSRPACRECVKSFGSSVSICSACGGLCKPKTELESVRHKDEFRTVSIDAGFGFGDFVQAIAYPFKFKASLIFGALMFMFFSLGRMAASFGGTYLIVGSIFSYMLANMLAFGILSNTINNFASGRIGGNFMPAFEDFSLWDDVIHPFFLSIGVYISAFGPFIAVFLVGSYLVMSSISSETDLMKANLEKTPGTPYYSVRDTLDQSDQVKTVVANAEKINQEHLDAQEKIQNGQPPDATAANQEEEDFQRINKMIADSKRKELESVVGQSPETRERQSAAFMTGLLKLAAPLVVVGFITFLWGLFFFPASCTVAGYTQSFVATVNPLIGLDTIKRLGFIYAKILVMAFLMLVVFAVISTVFAFVFSAFDMPGIGNLPARAAESLVWFYMVIVFACLLGLAIFKSSDRLKLVD